MEEQHRILGMHVSKRVNRAGDVQGVLSEYGMIIRTRLGLHQVHGDYGVILLELYGEQKVCRELREKLSAMDGVDVQEMIFDHPE